MSGWSPSPALQQVSLGGLAAGLVGLGSHMAYVSPLLSLYVLQCLRLQCLLLLLLLEALGVLLEPLLMFIFVVSLLGP